MIYEKTKNEIFASDAKDGEIVDFPNVKRGWGVTENLGFIPPMEYFNAAFNRVDKSIAYQLQRGVGEWDKDLEYPIGAVVSLNKIVYVAKSQNTNKNPSENKEEWYVLASEEWCDATFFKKTDEIDTATEQKAGIFKITNEITGSRNDVVATEAAVANNTLSFEPYNKVDVEAFSLESTTVDIKGVVYLSDKSSVPGRYYNTTKAIEAQLAKAQQKPNGTYFIKVKQDNSLELVSIRPEFHHKSITAEYYLDGVWYDKSGNKLPPQTYAPYSVTITANNITAVNFENIYPSSKELGVGQTWQYLLTQRRMEVLYTNTTGRPIMINVTVDSSSPAVNRTMLYVDGIRVSRFENVNGLATQLCAIVPDKKTYQVKGEVNASIVGIMDWAELR